MSRKKKINGDVYREFKPKTINQGKYVKSIINNIITLCTGVAGTGKTSCSAGIGVEYLLQDKIEKLVITRPVIESGRGLGFLPGNYIEKIHPYLVPILEELYNYLDPCVVQQKIREEIISIVPLEYMRGRNFHNSFIILDEGQNATLDQIKMLLTRIGNNSKCIIEGDLEQSDLKEDNIGLKVCIERLNGMDQVGIIKLGIEDIIRHPFIGEILERLRCVP